MLSKRNQRQPQAISKTKYVNIYIYMERKKYGDKNTKRAQKLEGKNEIKIANV